MQGRGYGGYQRGGYGGPNAGRGGRGNPFPSHEAAIPNLPQVAAVDNAAPAPAPVANDVNQALNGLPPQVATLLHQALAALTKQGVPAEKVGEQVKISDVPKPKGVDIPESSAQGEARAMGNKAPYCYRCLRKGHVMIDCKLDIRCDVCDSTKHVKARCPLYKVAAKMFAVPCGYAVEGLGFYYIPNTAVIKDRNDKTVMIRVIEGSLTTAQVTSELERLIPGRWKWVVEEVQANTFKTSLLKLRCRG